MDLAKLTLEIGDQEISRAIDLLARIKEDHQNLAGVDISLVLTESQRDDYLANFISIQTILNECRRAEETLKEYAKLEDEFAYFVAKKIANKIGLGKLKRGTYIEIGRALLKEKSQ